MTCRVRFHQSLAHSFGSSMGNGPAYAHTTAQSLLRALFMQERPTQLNFNEDGGPIHSFIHSRTTRHARRLDMAALPATSYGGEVRHILPRTAQSINRRNTNHPIPSSLSISLSLSLSLNPPTPNSPPSLLMTYQSRTHTLLTRKRIASLSFL